MKKSPELKINEENKKNPPKKYISPSSASMAEFSSRTALGVSPAMKKKKNYVVSVLF